MLINKTGVGAQTTGQIVCVLGWGAKISFHQTHLREHMQITEFLPH